MPLVRFVKGQRIRVSDATSPIDGTVGTCVRPLASRDTAFWVRMDAPIPAELRSDFPKNDPRVNDVVLYPDDCEAV